MLINYLDFDGRLIARKWQLRSRGKRRVEMALWRATRALRPVASSRGLKRSRGELHIVEGESDCWAFWYHGFAALGIPGASCARLLEREHFQRVRKYFVVEEPDQGGRAFIRGMRQRLRELGLL